jgi:hypothetical protein
MRCPKDLKRLLTRDGIEEENFIKFQSPKSRSNKKIDAFGKKS